MKSQGRWVGTLGAFIGGSLYTDLSSDDPSSFARGIDELEAKARMLLNLPSATPQEPPRPTDNLPVVPHEPPRPTGRSYASVICQLLYRTTLSLAGAAVATFPLGMAALSLRLVEIEGVQPMMLEADAIATCVAMTLGALIIVALFW